MEKVNWKEAFEQALANGGALGEYNTCLFCRMMGFKKKEYLVETVQGLCLGCPLLAENAKNEKGGCVAVIGRDFMDNSERRAICRHVLATVKDFTNRDEIRARIAEMLDDDAREKFVGKPKAEPEPRYTVQTFQADLVYGQLGNRISTNSHWPDHPHVIWEHYLKSNDAIIASFRDLNTAEASAAFLNKDAE